MTTRKTGQTASPLTIMDERFFWEMIGPADFLFLGGIIAEALLNSEEPDHRTGIFINAAANDAVPSRLELLWAGCYDDMELPELERAGCVFKIPPSSLCLERFSAPSEAQLRTSSFAEGYLYILHHMEAMMEQARRWLTLG